MGLHERVIARPVVAMCAWASEGEKKETADTLLLSLQKNTTVKDFLQAARDIVLLVTEELYVAGSMEHPAWLIRTAK